MTKELDLREILHLRLLVAFLGEKEQCGWWQTSFFGTTGTAVLGYSFPRSTVLAQYAGSSEAARQLHDAHIGVGRVFHLFRLPEELEQDLHRLAGESVLDVNSDALCRRDVAEEELGRLAAGNAEIADGPVSLGDRAALENPDSVRRMATLYFSAFKSGGHCYPYFRADV